MKAYLFTCSSDAAVQAASSMESGANLPQDMCRDGFWEHTGTVDLEDGGATALMPNVDLDTVRQALEEKGWIIDVAASTET